MAMDFGKTSEPVVKKINQELEKLLKEWQKEVKKTDMSLLPLVNKFIEACGGGKRLRGLLVVLGYEIASLKCKVKSVKLKNKEIYKIAAAFEIFHSAILAHDDVIDQSPKRRGLPSLYHSLGGDHRGISLAICLGDAGFFLATRIIAESNFPDEAKNKVLRLFSKIMLDTAAGEMLDVEGGDAVNIMKLKTAKYSVSGPLRIGGTLAGAEEKLMNQLEIFGENLGIAFQIRDDILGIFGSEKVTGKSAVSDMEEGKNTLLYAEAFKNADKHGRETLRKLYGRGKIHRQEAKEVRQLFRETGALDFAGGEVLRYQDKALRLVPLLTEDRKMVELLKKLTIYLIERNK